MHPWFRLAVCGDWRTLPEADGNDAGFSSLQAMNVLAMIMQTLHLNLCGNPLK
jgi:hypothetical protein